MSDASASTTSTTSAEAAPPAAQPHKLSKAEIKREKRRDIARREAATFAKHSDSQRFFVGSLVQCSDSGKLDVPAYVVEAALDEFRTLAPDTALLLVTAGPTLGQVWVDFPPAPTADDANDADDADAADSTDANDSAADIITDADTILDTVTTADDDPLSARVWLDASTPSACVSAKTSATVTDMSLLRSMARCTLKMNDAFKFPDCVRNDAISLLHARKLIVADTDDESDDFGDDEIGCM